VQSLNLDFLFDNVYNLMLSVKYFWYFTVLNMTEQEYLLSVQDSVWDGLRDREGWLSGMGTADEVITKAKDAVSFSQELPSNYVLESSNLNKEIQNSYGIMDKLKSYIGLNPRDTDNDGLADSYELVKGYNEKNPDSDNDGLRDMDELKIGTSPINADTDNDGVIDGRDFYPLDANVSVSVDDQDFDGDKVGDAVEKYIGSDNLTSDTDNDGMLDAYDISVNGDPAGYFGLQSVDITNIPVLSFEIKNYILLFVAQMLGVLYLVAVPILIYVMYKWSEQVKHDSHHYYSLFKGAYGYGDTENENTHSNKKDMLTELSEHKKSTMDVSANNVLHHDSDEIADFKNIWSKIESASNSQVEDERKISILQADNLLDDLLIKRGYMGQSMAERLSSANFKTIDLAWDVHKLRNKIAHGTGENLLSDREARKAILMYEVVFKDLNIL
jgi:Bacterial TSP3 repeat